MNGLPRTVGPSFPECFKNRLDASAVGFFLCPEIDPIILGVPYSSITWFCNLGRVAWCQCNGWIINGFPCLFRCLYRRKIIGLTTMEEEIGWVLRELIWGSFKAWAAFSTHSQQALGPTGSVQRCLCGAHTMLVQRKARSRRGDKGGEWDRGPGFRQLSLCHLEKSTKRGISAPQFLSFLVQ